MKTAKAIAENSPAFTKRRILWKAVNTVRSSFVKQILNLWKRKIRAFLEDDDALAISEAMNATYVEVGGDFARSRLNRIIR